MTDIPDDFSRRMGRVTISKFLVDDNPRAVMAALAYGIVFRCEFMYSTGEFEYRLIHVAFDPVPSNQLMPEYECLFTMHADRSVTHEWKRKA